MKKTRTSSKRWIIGVYNNNFEMIKPLRHVVGTYEKAEQTCEILQHRNPKKIVMFDHA